MHPFLHEEPGSAMSCTWKLDLTSNELAAIACALARVSAEEVAARLGRSPGEAAIVVARLRDKTAALAAMSARLQGQPVMMVDEESHAVVLLGDRFTCKPTAFRLLSHLIRRPGTWVRSESLQREVLGASAHDRASNVRWHVLQARRALGVRSDLLHSDSRLGYMFDVSPCDRRHCASQRWQHDDASVVRSSS